MLATNLWINKKYNTNSITSINMKNKFLSNSSQLPSLINLQTNSKLFIINFWDLRKKVVCKVNFQNHCHPILHAEKLLHLFFFLRKRILEALNSMPLWLRKLLCGGEEKRMKEKFTTNLYIYGSKVGIGGRQRREGKRRSLVSVLRFPRGLTKLQIQIQKLVFFILRVTVAVEEIWIWWCLL